MHAWRKAVVEPLKDREHAKAERRAERTVRRERSGTPTGRYRLAALLRDCCPRALRSEKGDDFIVAECPFDELHSNSGDPSDRAFWANNFGNCGCHHGHGDEQDADDYVAKILEDGWITAEQLAAYAIRKGLSPAEQMQIATAVRSRLATNLRDAGSGQFKTCGIPPNTARVEP